MELVITGGEKSKLNIPKDGVYITAHLNEAMNHNYKLASAVLDAFERFCDCDYGATHPEDAKLNDEAARTREGRVLAKYKMPKGAEDDIFISLEFDEPSMKRDICVIMFCGDY